MTKAEKIRIISTLLNDAENATDMSFAEEKLTQVINEIYSSGYDLKKLKIVSSSINTFIGDIPNNFVAERKNQFYVQMSKAALLSLIDLSQLPD